MIKNYNTKMRRLNTSVLLDDIIYIKILMKKLQKYNKDLKIILIPNLIGGYINLFIEYEFYTKYKDNLLQGILIDTKLNYLDEEYKRIFKK